MSFDPSTLGFTTDHEWLHIEGDVATIGVTDYAVEQLGEVVYLDLPQIGQAVTAGTVVGEIESTKSVGEIFAPVSGDIVGVNDDIVDTPETVNAEPFGTGWLIKIRFETAPEGLLTEAAYRAEVGR